MLKEVHIPKEIKNYKEKIILNLTLRQTISFILGIVAMIPLYLVFTIQFAISQETVGWIIILLGVPIMGIGFVSYKNMTLEKFIWQLIKTNFIYYPKRVYKNNNLRKEYYDEFIKYGKAKKTYEREKIYNTKIFTGYTSN